MVLIKRDCPCCGDKFHDDGVLMEIEKVTYFVCMDCLEKHPKNKLRKIIHKSIKKGTEYYVR